MEAMRKMRLAFLGAAVCVVLLASLSAVSAQQTSPDETCPSSAGATVENLDMKELSKGHWYDVRMIQLQGYTESKPRCPKTRFWRDLSVTTEFQTPNGTDNTLLGHLKNTDGKGGFSITYENIVTSGELQYNFLLAEYDDFLLIFGCKPLEGYQGREVNGWVLSRTPILTRNAEEKFNKQMTSLGILFPFIYFKDVDRQDCEDDTATEPPESTTTTQQKTSASTLASVASTSASVASTSASVASTSASVASTSASVPSTSASVPSTSPTSPQTDPPPSSEPGSSSTARPDLFLYWLGLLALSARMLLS